MTVKQPSHPREPPLHTLWCSGCSDVSVLELPLLRACGTICDALSRACENSTQGRVLTLSCACALRR